MKINKIFVIYPNNHKHSNVYTSLSVIFFIVSIIIMFNIFRYRSDGGGSEIYHNPDNEW